MERWRKISRIVFPLGLSLGAGVIWLHAGQLGIPLILIMGAGALLGWAVSLVLESTAVLTLAEPQFAAPLTDKIHTLEQEKATILRSIKEIELDLALQKLDPGEAAHLMAPLRAQAINVLRELDRTRQTYALTTDEQIEKELARRLADSSVKETR